MLGSLHPAYPFADGSVVGLGGTAFAVEAEDEWLLGWLHDIVSTLDGQVLIVPPGGKALYHAALCIASNYTVTLYALAEALLVGQGADRAAADSALNVLLAATVENLRVQGIPAALTGPLVRGDIETIKAHLKALDGVDSDVREGYIQLTRLTYPLLEARGIAPDGIEAVLKDGEDADHSS